MPERIKPEAVSKKMLDVLPTICGHLDFEGFAYVMITRDGAQSCFARDFTADHLEAAGVPRNKQGAFWGKPAMEKWGEKR